MMINFKHLECLPPPCSQQKQKVTSQYKSFVGLHTDMKKSWTLLKQEKHGKSQGQHTRKKSITGPNKLKWVRKFSRHV